MGTVPNKKKIEKKNEKNFELQKFFPPIYIFFHLDLKSSETCFKLILGGLLVELDAAASICMDYTIKKLHSKFRNRRPYSCLDIMYHISIAL